MQGRGAASRCLAGWPGRAPLATGDVKHLWPRLLRPSHAPSRLPWLDVSWTQSPTQMACPSSQFPNSSRRPNSISCHAPSSPSPSSYNAPRPLHPVSSSSNRYPLSFPISRSQRLPRTAVLLPNQTSFLRHNSTTAQTCNSRTTPSDHPEDLPLLTLEDFYLSDEEKVRSAFVERVMVNPTSVSLPSQLESNSAEHSVKGRSVNWDNFELPSAPVVSLPFIPFSRTAFPSTATLNKELELSWARKDIGKMMKLWDQMKDSAIAPSITTVNYMMKAFQFSGKVEASFGLLRDLSLFNLKPTVSICTSAINVHTQSNTVGLLLKHLFAVHRDNETETRLDLVRHVGEFMMEANLTADVHIHNALISVYLARRDYAAARQELNLMGTQEPPVQPDRQTFASLLDYCYEQRLAHEAKDLFERILPHKALMNPRMVDQFVALFTLDDSVEHFPQLMDMVNNPRFGLPPPPSFYLSLLSSAARQGNSEIANDIWTRFKAGIKAPGQRNSSGIESYEMMAYNAMLQAYLQAGNYREMLTLLEQMSQRGFELMPSMQRFIVDNLRGLSSSRERLITELWAIAGCGPAPPRAVATRDQEEELIMSSLEQSESLVLGDEPTEPRVSLTSANLVLASLAGELRPTRMFQVFAEMGRLGLRPNADSFNHLLDGCRLSRRRDLSDEVLSVMQRCESRAEDEGLPEEQWPKLVDPNTIHVLVQHWLQNDQIEDTVSLLSGLTRTNPLPETLVMLVRKCARTHRGHLQRALELMTAAGLRPDAQLHRYCARTHDVVPEGFVAWRKKMREAALRREVQGS